jgi:hypothetical protein
VITATARVRRVFGGRRRLDAGYFCSPGAQAAVTLDHLRVAGMQMMHIAGDDGLGTVFHPNRFKRQIAAPAEVALPFLRAFDVFEYLPQPADWVSEARTEKIDDLRVAQGDILLTRSGRNLGPSVIVDSHLAQFIPSDDLLRVRIADGKMRNYAFAYLSSSIGQQLLRQDKTGSVIDHLSAEQVGKQAVPIIDEIFDAVADEIGQSVAIRSSARKYLVQSVEAMQRSLPKPNDQRLRDGWTVRAARLSGRLDVAFHSQHVTDAREDLLSAGGVRLGDVARVHKPAGRYKTYYVGQAHGTPLLSGRNLLQAMPIGLKHISSRSIAENSGYELKPGWICFQADGRAEERLGFPIMVTSERNGWLASGHVARLIPHKDEDAGWLWSAMASLAVQEQIAALACGSVVDALYEDDLKGVVIPPRSAANSESVREAWEMFAEAKRLESKAIGRVQEAISQRAVQ